MKKKGFTPAPDTAAQQHSSNSVQPAQMANAWQLEASIAPQDVSGNYPGYAHPLVVEEEEHLSMKGEYHVEDPAKAENLKKERSTRRREKWFTWIYVGVLAVAMTLCLAALASESWCKLHNASIGLNMITVPIAESTSDYKMNLLGVSCDAPMFSNSQCMKFKAYVFTAIVVQIAGSVTLFMSAATLTLTIWMQLSKSFNHYLLLGWFSPLSSFIWVYAVFVSIAGFISLKTNASNLEMDAGYGLAFTSLIIYVAATVFSYWKLPNLTFHHKAPVEE